MNYIKSMRGLLGRARGYASEGYELLVTIQFDAKEFNRLKKTQDPLGAAMPQIKNVVLDACGVRGMPSYAPVSYGVRYPRARGGLVKLTVYFDVSEFTAKALGFNASQHCVLPIDLQTTLDLTRNDGHMFAKTAIASHFGN